GCLVGQDVALEALIAPGAAVPADADVAKHDVPGWETRDGPHLHVIAVEVLLGDAVADHYDAVAIFEEELVAAGQCHGQEQRDQGDVSNDSMHKFCSNRENNGGELLGRAVSTQ